MSHIQDQQIIISGVGGQGVLFITRLLAEAAIEKGIAVFTSETHGMAQRGGTVVSHLKIGSFASPLIRPGMADFLLALKPESVGAHAGFLKPGGRIFLNSSEETTVPAGMTQTVVDADGIARSMENHRSANLVLLGAALAAGQNRESRPGELFCRLPEMKSAIGQVLGGKTAFLDTAFKSIEAGFAEQNASAMAGSRQ